MPSPSLPPSPQITHTWNALYSTHGRCVPCLCVLFACSVPVVNITPIRCTSTDVCGPSCNYLFLFLVCSVMYYLLFLSDVPSRAPPGNSHEGPPQSTRIPMCLCLLFHAPQSPPVSCVFLVFAAVGTWYRGFAAIFNNRCARRDPRCAPRPLCTLPSPYIRAFVRLCVSLLPSTALLAIHNVFSPRENGLHVHSRDHSLHTPRCRFAGAKS